MIFYRLQKNKLYSKDIGAYFSYGIAAFANSSITPIYSVKDISLKKKPLEKLVFLCNNTHLSIIHLDDVIEDFLSINIS